MSFLTPIDLTSRGKSSSYHNISRDMETAICWNSIKKTLEDIHKPNLFSYIKSVKVSDTSITIKTEKPIVNMEISLYQEILKEHINSGLVGIGSHSRKKLSLV